MEPGALPRGSDQPGTIRLAEQRSHWAYLLARLCHSVEGEKRGQKFLSEISGIAGRLLYLFRVTPQKLYSINELAAEIGRSPWFVRAAIEDGLEHHRQGRKGWIYVTLDQWARYMERTLIGGNESTPATAKAQPRGKPAPRKRVLSRRDPQAYAETTF